jgi:uncharacterized membrane protein
MLDVDGFMGAIFGITIIGIVVSLLVPIAIIILVVWAIRRSAPARRDPAEQELRDRLASGEIDMAEFQVRLRALREGDET